VIVALDIDDTITTCPAFFSALSSSVRRAGGRVIIVTSRTNNAQARRETESQLRRWKIQYDALHMLDGAGRAAEICPYSELDWYARYLWQKIDICLREHVDVVYDDDAKVVALFRRFAPGIHVHRVVA